MNNKNKNDVLNLVFSAFLVIAFVICAYFFVGIIKDNFETSKTMGLLMTALVFAVFGGVLFYATRVGDGKQVWRFSPATLIIMVLPSLYIIIASIADGLPFHEKIASCSELVYLAGVVLGYGIPYTILSGYELDTSEEDSKSKENSKDKKSDADSESTSDDESDTDSDTSSDAALDELVKSLESDSSDDSADSEE